MCGRFVRTSSLDEVVAAFEVTGIEALHVSFNVAPTTAVYVIRHDETEKVVESMMWGLVPFWAKDASRAANSINARAETLTEKPSFRHLVRSHRCVMPMNGYYEWDTVHAAKGAKKQPYFVAPRRGGVLDHGTMFGAASLWSTWVDPHDERHVVHSVSMVTTQATGSLSTIHHRMPVLLSQDEMQEWLDPLRGLPTWISSERPVQDVDVIAVSMRVNSVKNNDEHLLDPIEAVNAHDRLF